jgi:hypothetical protein
MGEDHPPMVWIKPGKPLANKPQQTVFVDVERNSPFLTVGSYPTDFPYLPMSPTESANEN